MTHRMGLVQLNPTTKSVATTLTYTYNKADGGYTSSTSGTSTITASDDFTGNKPYHANSQYGHIVKATGAATNIAKAFTCNVNQKDFWSEKSSGSDVGYGRYKVINIQSDRNAANFVALFSCVKTCQTVTLPWYDTYKMECWGANGSNHTSGTTTHYGGISGYVAGIIAMEKNKTLYVYVGDQSGFNGGGIVGPSTQLPFGSNGGGGTDVRLSKHNDTQYNTIWGGVASLRSRIIVAAGGGGANNRWEGYGEGDGGYGGGLTGGTGQSINATNGNNATQYGGNQDSGGQVIGHGSAYTGKNFSDHWGRFGCAAQYGVHDISDYDANTVQTGGGAGWYGGGGWAHSGGGGGSSFISGMTGCNGIDTSTGNHRGAGQPSIVDGKTYTFDNTVMHAGNSASRPSNPGGVVGYAKITSQ